MDLSPPLEGNLLRGLTRSVRRVVGFNLSEEDVAELYSGELDLLREILNAGGAYDTTINEMISDVFARAMVGRSWPIAEEGPKVSDDFFKDLTAAAKECGWIPMAHLA